MSLISPKELDAIMSPDNYLGKAPEMVDSVVQHAELVLGMKVC